MDDSRDNWDLSAVVKSCSSTTKLTMEEPDPPPACHASLTFHEHLYAYSSLFQSYNHSPFLSTSTTGISNRTDYCTLSDLVNPLPPPLPSPVVEQLCRVHHLQQPDHVHASMSGINCPPPLVFFQQQKQPQAVQLAAGPFNPIPTTDQDPLRCRLLPAPPPPPSRSRKRKVQQKRTVTHVTGDKLTSDEWAWRKYGQKPIKGSPYPRNYYRCSSSKGCSARKQVEQSRSDPEIYIVTCTGDHTHPRPSYRNSLAGSTRSKSAGNTAQRLEATEEGSSCNSLVSVTGPTAAAPGVEEDMVGSEDQLEEDDDEDLLLSNLIFDDDLFKGLEEFAGTGLAQISPSSFGDNFSTSSNEGGSPAGGATAAGSG